MNYILTVTYTCLPFKWWNFWTIHENILPTGVLKPTRLSELQGDHVSWVNGNLKIQQNNALVQKKFKSNQAGA